jgi:hypothetical protein
MFSAYEVCNYKYIQVCNMGVSTYCCTTALLNGTSSNSSSLTLPALTGKQAPVTAKMVNDCFKRERLLYILFIIVGLQQLETQLICPAVENEAYPIHPCHGFVTVKQKL